MELLIMVAAAAGILALIAFMSPGVERRRVPVHHAVGRDHHSRATQRTAVRAQVTSREAPRTLRVNGQHIRPIVPTATAPAAGVPAVQERVASPAFLAASAFDDSAAMLQLPPRPAVPPRLDWARQGGSAVDPVQRERNADRLVASLLG